MDNIYNEGDYKISTDLNSYTNPIVYFIDLDSKKKTLADHIESIKSITDREFENSNTMIYFCFIGFDTRNFVDFGVSYLCTYIQQIKANGTIKSCTIIIRGMMMSDILKTILDTNLPVMIYSDVKISVAYYDGGTIPGTYDCNIKHVPINEYKTSNNLEFTILA